MSFGEDDNRAKCFYLSNLDYTILTEYEAGSNFDPSKYKFIAMFLKERKLQRVATQEPTPMDTDLKKNGMR